MNPDDTAPPSSGGATIPAPPPSDLRVAWPQQAVALDDDAPTITGLRKVTFFPSVLQPPPEDFDGFASDALDED